MMIIGLGWGQITFIMKHRALTKLPTVLCDKLVIVNAQNGHQI